MESFRRWALNFFLIVAVAYLAFFLRQDSSLLSLNISTGKLVFGFFCQLSCLAASMWAWSRTLGLYVDHKLSVHELLSQISVSLLGKYIPGKIWGFWARAMVCRRDHISSSTVLVASLLEHIYSVVFGGLVGLSLMLIDFGFFVSFFAFIFLFVSAVFFFARLPLIINAIREWPFINIIFRRFSTGVFYIPGFSVWNALPFLLGAISLVAVFWVVVSSLGLNMPFLTIIQLSGYMLVGVVVGYLAFFVPGGIGVREGVFVALTMHHIGLEAATVISLVFRLWLSAYDLIAGVSGYLLHRLMLYRMAA